MDRSKSPVMGLFSYVSWVMNDVYLKWLMKVVTMRSSEFARIERFDNPYGLLWLDTVYDPLEVCAFFINEQKVSPTSNVAPYHVVW